MSSTGDAYELRITANDEAAVVVDKLADKVEDLTDGKHEVDIKADTKPAEKELKGLDKLLDGLSDDKKALLIKAKADAALKEIERIDRGLARIEDEGELQIRLQARDEATERLRDVMRLAEELEEPIELDIVIDERGNAGRVRKEFDDTAAAADRAQRGIGTLRGVTDELGESSAQFGIYGAAVVDAGETVQIFSQQLGLTQAQADKLSGALGTIGIAGVAAFAVAAEVMGELGKRTEATKKLTEGWSAAIASGVDPVQDLTNSQRELNEELKVTDRFTGGKQFLPWADSVKSLNNQVLRAGLTMEQFNQLVADGEDAIGAWINAQIAAGHDVPIDLISAFGQSMEALDDAQQRAQVSAELFALSTDQIAAAMQRLALEKDPIAAFPEEFERIAEALANGTTPAVTDVDAVMKGLNITLDEAIKMADDLANSEDDAASSARSLALAQKEAAQAAAAHRYEHDQLKNSLNDRASFLNLLDGFDQLEVAATEAFTAAVDGAADAEAKARDYEQSLIDQKLRVQEYATEVLGLPAEVVSRIVAELDPDSGTTIDEVKRELEELSKGVDVPIRFTGGGKPAVNFGGGRGGYASGTTAAQPGVRWVGEEGPELVNFRGGERVHSAPESQRIASGGTVTIINNYPPGLGAREVSRATRNARRRGFGRGGS